MDYSIVVGVDYHGQELVVGIVDYIRTYTWDKVLETWVKETVFTGRNKPGNEPSASPPVLAFKARVADRSRRLFLRPQPSSRPSSTASASRTRSSGTSHRRVVSCRFLSSHPSLTLRS